MTKKFNTFYARLTPAQKARLWTLLLTGMSAVAATGDKIVGVPFLPPWAANAWPVLVAVDIAALKVISIFTNPNTPQAPSNPQ